MPLRFCLLNVQGLTSKRTNKLNSSEFQNIFSSNDIILITESWTDEYSDIEVSNFDTFVLHRKEKKKGCKRNSGGIVVFIRSKYVTKDTLVYTSQDDIIWVKFDKALFAMSTDLYVGLCYVVPDDSSRQSLIDTNIFDRLLDSFIFIENTSQNDCTILLCGDFNSRSSNSPDYVVDDDSVHMSVLPDEYVSDTQLPRFSEDTGHTNNNGLLLLDFCKQTGLRIMNGRVGNDRRIGRYTFVGSRGSSVVDYVLASQSLFDYIKDFEVQDPNILSDHCCIDFSLDFSCDYENFDVEDNEQVKSKYVWNTDLKGEFLNRLHEPSIVDRLEHLNFDIAGCHGNDDIELCVWSFIDVLDEVSNPLFSKKISNFRNAPENNYQDKETNQPWYTDECREKQFYFYKMLQKFREGKTNENRINMVKARSEYKTVLRKCKYEYDKKKTESLINAKFKNAKLYWNLLKSSAGIKPGNIPLSSFEQYFKAVNNPDDHFYTPDDDVLFLMNDMKTMNSLSYLKN